MPNGDASSQESGPRVPARPAMNQFRKQKEYAEIEGTVRHKFASLEHIVRAGKVEQHWQFNIYTPEFTQNVILEGVSARTEWPWLNVKFSLPWYKELGDYIGRFLMLIKAQAAQAMVLYRLYKRYDYSRSLYGSKNTIKFKFKLIIKTAKNGQNVVQYHRGQHKVKLV